MRFGLTVVAAGVALLLAACAERDLPPPVADASTQRALTGGDVVGFIDVSNGAQVWLGLPFAAAPQGDLRWRAPRAHEGWTGMHEALSHGAPCPQVTNALNAEATGAQPGELVGDEDCLFLDVYAPSGAGPQDADRPVMMWIHGGSNTWGSAAQYDGAQLAADQNVVVVMVQYRLGPLGFFAHPLLAADADQPTDAAANFALLDQIAALEWIQANAAQFGGDAGNVTIFGESAGGHNVVSLLASPLAEGLFHRAIIQSGSFRSAELDEARSHPQYGAVPAAQRFAGADADAAAIRAADLETVYSTYMGESGMLELATIIRDGVTIPTSPLEEAFSSTDSFTAVPIITGTTRDEMKLFNAFDPELSSRLFGVIFRSRDRDLYDTTAEYQSRIWRAQAVDDAANAMTAAGHEDVWAYRFDWDEGGSMFFMDFSHLLGAAHAMEIPFVFNHFTFFGRLDPALFNNDNAAGRSALAGSMGAYWAEFARTGDPGRAGGPHWPAWESEGVLMRFDSPADGGPEVITGPESVEQILTDLAEDASLNTAQRCMVFRRLEGWIEDGAPSAGFGCS
jgi:para-nitrobenzyl esterase